MREYGIRSIQSAGAVRRHRQRHRRCRTRNGCFFQPTAVWLQGWQQGRIGSLETPFQLFETGVIARIPSENTKIQSVLRRCFQPHGIHRGRVLQRIGLPDGAGRFSVHTRESLDGTCLRPQGRQQHCDCRKKRKCGGRSCRP